MMKVFALLLFAMTSLMSCATPWHNGVTGLYEPSDKNTPDSSLLISNLGDEDGGSEPIKEEDPPTLKRTIVPYDFEKYLLTDWQNLKNEWKEEDDIIVPIPDEETDIEEPQELKEDQSFFTGDEIVALACLLVFMICVFLVTYNTLTKNKLRRLRRDEDDDR